MTMRRVLVLVHKDLVPPEAPAADIIDDAPWKMEWDVVSTLREGGHELRVIGVHDDLTPIRSNVEEFKPDIVFNLMEAFADIGVFDQNVVSYLELLRVPYTGCNPRGLTLARDKALAKKLFAYHRMPVPDFTVVPLNRKPSVPKKLSFPLIVKSLDLRVVDRHLAGVGGGQRRAARQARAVHPRVDRHGRHRRAVHRRPRAVRRRDRQPAAAGVPGVGDVFREDAARTAGTSPPSG